MKSSLIITTYNWSEALELVLLSILEQTVLPSEIVIADDGSTSKTKELIDNYRQKFTTPLIHIWQEDNGFRASSIRNKAIAKANGDYIILIDGDMILDRYFIEDHLKNAKTNYFIQGGRVLLSKKKSTKVIQHKQINFFSLEKGLQNRKNSIHSTIVSNIFSNQKKTLKGIKTCNFSFFKKDALLVNGFNESFIGWGREDSEFVARLYNNGVNRQTIKFNCIAYHIWHNENSRKNLSNNDKLLELTIEKRLKWCDNGIDKYLKAENES